MPFIVLLILIGAALGYVAGVSLNLKIRTEHAMLAGAFGGVLGGIGLRFLLSGLGAFIGALLGAAILVAALQVLTAKR